MKINCFVPGVCFIVMAMSFTTHAQKQLVLMKGEKVLERYFPGDDFAFRLKGSGKLHSSFVNNIFVDEMMTFDDTIKFIDMKRVYLNEYRRYRSVQILGTMARAAGLFFLFDDANTNVIHGKTPDHQQVAKANIALYDPGVSMMFIRRKSFRLNGRYKLMMVEKGSYFYQENPKGFQSQYIPN